MIKIKTQILAYEHAGKKTNKQKGCLITSNQRENMPLVLKISFQPFLCRKPAQTGGSGQNYVK